MAYNCTDRVFVCKPDQQLADFHKVAKKMHWESDSDFSGCSHAKKKKKSN